MVFKANIFGIYIYLQAVIQHGLKIIWLMGNLLTIPPYSLTFELFRKLKKLIKFWFQRSSIPYCFIRAIYIIEYTQHAHTRDDERKINVNILYLSCVLLISVLFFQIYQQTTITWCAPSNDVALFLFKANRNF